ncbi:hypothetical protein C7M84_016772 [Penaeus vannamei]|uniref:Integrase catalytic domain-containing protein n=1 Tax=Penaeus vannamei TaxID=6689 RepID=A0A3R7MM32_PENVA|nr:hypothetical protein C7M84_016772 [Penaeus vannamei]
MLRSSRTLKGVAGMPKSVEAEADLKFTIHPGLDLVHRTCITSGIHFPGDMLVGMDLLRRLPVVIFISPNSSDSYLELDGHRHVVTFVGEESSHCCEVPACHESRGELPESSIPLQPRYVSPVHVTEATTIEPRAGRFVAASLSRSVPDETHVAVIEGNAARLLVPRTLITVQERRSSIWVVNTEPKPRKLSPGTIVGYAELVETSDLQTTSQFLQIPSGGTLKETIDGEPIRSPDYACPVGNSVADPEPNPDTPLLEVPPSVQDQQMQEPQPHQMPNLTTLASQQMREQQLQDPVCTDLIAWLERPQLHTDNGLEFSSDEWRSLLKELEVRHSFSVAYHPQSNGVVERSNRVVKDALAALVQQSPSQWPIHLPAVRFALNSAIHRSTSDQPLYLLTGRMALFPRGLTNLQTIDEGQMVKCLADARRIAIKTTLETREANKRYYDRKAKPLHLNEGSLVLRKVEGSTRALDSRWKGPFRVLKKIGPVTYDILELQQPHRTMRVHANQLRPFVPASEIDFVEEGDQLPYPLVNFEFDAAPESSELLTDSENGSGDGNGLLRI